MKGTEQLLGYGDAYEIGERVVEMCDRVKTMDSIAPGTQATWIIGVDEMDFEIIVRVKREKVTKTT